jgi:hypothetical protein
MLLPLTPLVTLAVLLAPLQEAPVERVGAHIKVVSHLAKPELADEALAAAEAAWPLALEALGVKEKKVDAPLELHLYPDAASYEAAEQPLTGGKFKANLAFSHFASKSTHIALQPPCSPEALAEFGLPTLTAYLVAREASHLASYVHCENALDFPEWFAEGMAIDVGTAALVGLGRMRAGEAEPLVARYAALCQQMVEKDELPEAGKILAGESGNLEFHARYSSSYRFYAFLRAKHAKDMERIVKAIRTQEGGDGYRAGLMAELGRQWKGKELDKLHKEWVAAVKAAKPEWDEVYRSLESRGDAWVQRGFGDSFAIAFVPEGPKSVPFTVTGTVRVLPGEGTQMNFLLGRTPKGFLSVAMNFGHGVSVFRFESGAKEEWRNLATAESRTMPIGKDVSFRLEANAAELVVFLDDQETLRAPLGGRSPVGPWGLGAQPKTTGVWKSIAVRAAEKAKD